MTDTVRPRLQAVLEGFIHDEGELNAVLRGDDFLQAVSIDSMAFLDLVVRLENEFGLSFGYEGLETAFANIDSLCCYLRQHSAG